MAISLTLALAALSAATSGLFVVFNGSPVEAAMALFATSLMAMLATRLPADD